MADEKTTVQALLSSIETLAKAAEAQSGRGSTQSAEQSAAAAKSLAEAYAWVMYPAQPH